MITLTKILLTLLLSLGVLLAPSQSLAKQKIHPSYNTLKSNPKLIGKDRNRFFAYLGGEKGLLLCFHGKRGSARGWTKDAKREYLDYFQKQGYSFICPSSETDEWTDGDIIKVDKLLNDLGIDENQEVIMVGHSNGGKFASQYAQVKNTRAIHFANSRGSPIILRDKNWTYPSFFSYAECDQKVHHKLIERGYNLVQSDKEAVTLDQIYSHQKSQTCHEFVNIAQYYLDFINRKTGAAKIYN